MKLKLLAFGFLVIFTVSCADYFIPEGSMQTTTIDSLSNKEITGKCLANLANPYYVNGETGDALLISGFCPKSFNVRRMFSRNSPMAGDIRYDCLYRINETVSRTSSRLQCPEGESVIIDSSLSYPKDKKGRVMFAKTGEMISTTTTVSKCTKKGGSTFTKNVPHNVFQLFVSDNEVGEVSISSKKYVSTGEKIEGYVYYAGHGHFIKFDDESCFKNVPKPEGR